ncbi:MAG: hypothetical protein K9W45_04555 [Candidatus Heimdallarchaeum aukensis]|uniref:Integron cassette protein domain-containing protein n=1 Tax=Candidatus Heimdallarchaeum aukensis TaxID=2876573 RepID=A0A9Y1BMK2_9ARCH|nr:MAG: hypothetical protein K9W45_04555 [Candidatus Heimdallarchaeum aukensis]
MNNKKINKNQGEKQESQAFTMSIFSRRWGHEDNYIVFMWEEGWKISSHSGIVECNKRFEPGLYDILKHDSINYPKNLPLYFEWFWEEAQEQGLNHEEIQEGLTELTNWINRCEISTPSKGIFERF